MTATVAGVGFLTALGLAVALTDKSAHGAAIGQLDPEELFYLQSRGLSMERARNLLTYAFAAEVIDRIPVASLRARKPGADIRVVPGTGHWAAYESPEIVNPWLLEMLARTRPAG